MIFRRRKKDPMRALMRALVSVKTANARLGALENRISSRRQFLVQKSIMLEERGETFLAKKYEEEAKRLAVYEQRIGTLRLILEKLAMTIEMNLEFREVKGNLKDMLAVIDILKSLPESTLPELSIAIHEMEENVKVALAATSVEALPDIPLETHSSVDAEKILMEAKALAESKLMGELST